MRIGMWGNGVGLRTVIGARLSIIHGTLGPSTLPMVLSQILSRALRCIFGLFVLFNSLKTLKEAITPLTFLLKVLHLPHESFTGKSHHTQYFFILTGSGIRLSGRSSG